MYRTIQLPLITTSEQDIILIETCRQFTEAYNAVCKIAWDANEKDWVRLHHLTYYTTRAQLPNLIGALHIQACNKATTTIKSVFKRREIGSKVSCPKSNACPPRYNAATITVNWQTQFVSLSTTARRQLIQFILPETYIWAKEGKVCSAELIRRNGNFWLYICIESNPPKVRKNKTVIGVDLGINRPAVTSHAKFLGKREWKESEARIFRQRRDCQAKGTRRAKQHLVFLRGRQARSRKNYDHILSRQVIDSIKPGGTIALENLTGIKQRTKMKRGKQQRKLHDWSFARLQRFIAYKAEEKGIRTALIDPRYTSQTCSECGYRHSSNRKTQSQFKCKKCAFQLNADLNAARNIRTKYLTSLVNL